MENVIFLQWKLDPTSFKPPWLLHVKVWKTIANLTHLTWQSSFNFRKYIWDVLYIKRMQRNIYLLWSNQVLMRIGEHSIHDTKVSHLYRCFHVNLRKNSRNLRKHPYWVGKSFSLRSISLTSFLISQALYIITWISMTFHFPDIVKLELI